MNSDLTQPRREAFDALVQDVIDELPDALRELIDQVPVIVEDRPTPAMVKQLQKDGLLEPSEDGTDLCGLHSGVSITDRSIDDPTGGWDVGGGAGGADEADDGRADGAGGENSLASDAESESAAAADDDDDAPLFGGEAVYLFRLGIISLAFAGEDDGGYEGDQPCDWEDPDAEERLYEEIRTTILHEIGHHFGLDEDDLERLGYA